MASNIQISGDKLKAMVGSAFYLGYLPFMPGTFGALPGIGIYYCLWQFLPVELLRIGLLIAIVLLIFLTYALSPWAVKYWNSKDPSQFILDEIIGFLCVPLFYGTHDFVNTAVIGFLLFRICDIIKLPIANYIDKNVKGATGIIFDDVVSAAYAASILFLINVFLGGNLI